MRCVSDARSAGCGCGGGCAEDGRGSARMVCPSAPTPPLFSACCHAITCEAREGICGCGLAAGSALPRFAQARWKTRQGTAQPQCARTAALTMGGSQARRPLLRLILRRSLLCSVQRQADQSSPTLLLLLAMSHSDSLAAEVERLAIDSDAQQDAEEERQLSLPAHFYRAQARYTAQRITNKEPCTAQTAAQLRGSLLSLQKRIESAGFFSSNESSPDDLSTASMKFLLVPYFIGQVESAFPCAIEQRLTHVLAAARAFDEFMKRLESYGLLEKQEMEAQNFDAANREVIKKLTASPAAASSSSASSRPPMPSSFAPLGPGGKRLDPNAARTAKMARHRLEKDLSAQLQSLQIARANSFRTKKDQSKNNNFISASHSSGAGDGDDVEDEALDAGSDEADVRAFYILLLQKCVMSCVDATRSAAEEADILVHYRDVEARKPKQLQLGYLAEEEARARAAGQGAHTRPSDGPKPVMYKMTPDSLNQPIPAHMKHLLQGVPQPGGTASAAPGSVSSASSSSSSTVAYAAAPIPSSISSEMNRLISSRMPARETVFALTNQPTYSIEQWADMEIAAGRMPGPNSNPQPRAPDSRRIRSQADRDTAEEMVAAYNATADPDSEELGHEDGAAGMEKAELKQLKDREWDNWKDEHQKGAGNTMK